MQTSRTISKGFFNEERLRRGKWRFCVSPIGSNKVWIFINYLLHIELKTWRIVLKGWIFISFNTTIFRNKQLETWIKYASPHTFWCKPCFKGASARCCCEWLQRDSHPHTFDVIKTFFLVIPFAPQAVHKQKSKVHRGQKHFIRGTRTRVVITVTCLIPAELVMEEKMGR